MKTIDDSFISAKDRVLVECGSILGEFLEHESSESNSANLVFSFHSLGREATEAARPGSMPRTRCH